MEQIPVEHVAGVGPAKARALRDLGIASVHDLLHHYPFRYEDLRPLPFEAFPPNGRVTAQAVVETPPKLRWHGRRSVLTAGLRVDDRHRILGVWFNQHYLKPKLTEGTVVTVTGRWEAAARRIIVSQTEWGIHADGHRAFTPVYHAGQGITSSQVEACVRQALHQFADQLQERLPQELRDKYRLVSHAQALRWIHAPASAEQLRQARRRLAFEEFFLFQLQLQWFRKQRQARHPGEARPVPDDAWPRFTAALPARMTGAQQRACAEILQDLRSERAMTRLLQGDVGSGKTWVALWAAYAVHRAGAQSALMAPTEILAEQHAAEAERRLGPLGMRVCLLTGSVPDKERQARLRAIEAGDVHLVVGTHALLTESVRFAQLGLVITDEQHRFGVAQRALLRSKGRAPDVLMMSATPIPRTLALAVYGDLDVSMLNERPPGRQPVDTVWVRPEKEAEVLRRVRQALARGEQAYIVAPLVEDSDKSAELASATQLYERFREELAGFTVGLLHGRMSPRDKDQVMRSFASGETQVLVSTTVIEVGIDVPNATVMVIYHAERFGLAQLHQLRGRVGRGQARSLCILVSDATTEMAQARLKTLCETEDGFLIAEKDLELRGPGEVFGIRQSGLPEFTVGDLARDLRMMEVARDEARSLVESRDFWLMPAYAPLRTMLVEQSGAERVET